MSDSFTRALLFELDGTAIPKKPNAKPSQKVIQAIQRAKKHALIVFATNHNWKSAKVYAKLFEIDTPCITLGGSQVVDAATNKVIWEQDLDPGVPQKIVDLADTIGAKVYNYDTHKFILPRSYKVKSVEPIIVLQVTEKASIEAIKQIKKIPLLNVETSPAMEKGYVQINIKHIHATKFMALQVIAKKLKLNPRECIGVGDGSGDITLLNFCGIKIAMGSATNRLKELAQHIAPTIHDDGLAWVIDKFVVIGG